MVRATWLVSLVLFWLAFVPQCVAQNQDTEAQTLRLILAELRAIHEDMRVTETTQLLVAELQMQQAAAIRSTESVDDARAKLNQIHLDQKRTAEDLARAEDQLDKAQNTDERHAISQRSL